jgi:hypothetical protein
MLIASATDRLDDLHTPAKRVLPSIQSPPLLLLLL